MNKLIYLASPYSSADKAVIEKRVMNVGKATAFFIEAGNLVFSPILHSHYIADLVSFDPLNHAADKLTGWMAYDFAFIEKADELWVLKLEGWQFSHGVAVEIEHAKASNKPVRYFSFPSMEESSERDEKELSANS